MFRITTKNNKMGTTIVIVNRLGKVENGCSPGRQGIAITTRGNIFSASTTKNNILGLLYRDEESYS